MELPQLSLVLHITLAACLIIESVGIRLEIVSEDAHHRVKRTALFRQKWDLPRSSDGKIYIPVDMSNATEFSRGLLQNAMDSVSQRTLCVRFKNRTKNDRRYIHLTDQNKGCYARLGMRNRGGSNASGLNLGKGCQWRQPKHELMHSLGFNHEHRRMDRDDYIQVLWENIKGKALRKNWRTVNPKAYKDIYYYDYKRQFF